MRGSVCCLKSFSYAGSPGDAPRPAVLGPAVAACNWNAAVPGVGRNNEVTSMYHSNKGDVMCHADSAWVQFLQSTSTRENLRPALCREVVTPS